MERKSNHIRTLTPLRGVAALWILATHVDATIAPLLPAGSTGLLTKGYLWVDFFFLLSGFVICHVYGDQFARGASPSNIQSYLAARFARLYPMHLFTLTVFGVLSVVMRLNHPYLVHDDGFVTLFGPKLFFLNLVMGHAFGLSHTASWNVLSWSVAAEWWTYLVAVPLLPLLHGGIRRRIWPVAAVCVLGLAMLVQATNAQDLNVTYDYGFLRCLFEFTLGVILYQFYRTGRGAPFFRRDACFVAAAACVLALLHMRAPDLLLVPIFAWLILAAASNTGLVRRILTWRIPQRLGEMSYSIYMVQSIWLFVFMAGLSMAGTGAGSTLSGPGAHLLALTLVGLTLLSAGLTYRLIEVPARRTWRAYLTRDIQKGSIMAGTELPPPIVPVPAV
ncbi:MAG TPA: acyltransferase [Rhodothermales bacterium]|nr:acyltransferase [Rhodothermales bacterium]